jgi:hypothetical protein
VLARLTTGQPGPVGSRASFLLRRGGQDIPTLYARPGRRPSPRPVA